jgi:hypothetical protein
MSPVLSVKSIVIMSKVNLSSVVVSRKESQGEIKYRHDFTTYWIFIV